MREFGDIERDIACIEEELTSIKEKIETLREKRDALLCEKAKFQLEHKLFHSPSELDNYKSKKLSSITLILLEYECDGVPSVIDDGDDISSIMDDDDLYVESANDGLLRVKGIVCNSQGDRLEVDKNGHIRYNSLNNGYLEFQDEKDRYCWFYCGSETWLKIEGFLDLKLDPLDKGEEICGMNCF